MPHGRTVCSALLLVLLAAAPSHAQSARPLGFVDLMQFRTVHDPALSPDGAWVAFTARPDRGDPEVVVRFVSTGTRYSIARGSAPVFSENSGWLAARLVPPLEEVEAAADDADAPKPGMALLELVSGELRTFDDVERFAFSADGRWLAYHRTAPPDTTAADTAGARVPGAPLVLRSLGTGRTAEIPHVRTFAFDEAGRYVAYAVATPDSTRDGLYVRDLRADDLPERVLDARPGAHYGALAWSEHDGRLAFLAAVADPEADAAPQEAALWTWDGTDAPATRAAAPPAGWRIPPDGDLAWSDDGARLFFGYRPALSEAEAEAADTAAAFDPYDVDAILAGRGVDVWHWNDPRIIPHQKEQWEEEQQRTHAAVYHVADGRAVRLGDEDLRVEDDARRADVVLARSPAPYLREVTWEGFFYDLYVVALADGARTRVAVRLSDAAGLSPGGRYVAYYDDARWHLYDVRRGTTRTLTDGLAAPFADEDHDYPGDAPGYGLAGWTEGDAAVLVYDKYDLWQFPTDPDAAPARVTRGREDGRIFRVVETDPEREAFAPAEALLLRGYDDRAKTYGFYRARLGAAGTDVLLASDHRYDFVARAEDADVLLYTRQAYDEFPDLWVAGPAFRDPRKVTSVNPQLEEFGWGEAELVEWNSLDGLPLQGVVIKPAGYEEGRRYPVLVYFYRFMSQRLHAFNEPVVNHRPSFPLYASDGYVVFLPDVRFEVGRPGMAAVKSVVPGVQKLVDMGLADPDALGLHGHSWSGYQTAFIVTQTDLFDAAVAGAPVSNMTSAYSGIRWGSGLARQFQYERGQSRIGGSLWEARDRYIDNSPVFFADQIETPLLIMFGDEDGAVPWTQGIELYLALRRLGKEAVFLQYRGEPHHPQQYANKLDYSIKMKQFFDHHLKGAPAPDWLEEGIPYGGE